MIDPQIKLWHCPIDPNNDRWAFDALQQQLKHVVTILQIYLKNRKNTRESKPE